MRLLLWSRLAEVEIAACNQRKEAAGELLRSDCRSIDLREGYEKSRDPVKVKRARDAVSRARPHKAWVRL